LLTLDAGDPADAEKRLCELWPHVRAVGHFELGLGTGAAIALARLAQGDEAGAAQVLIDEVAAMVESTGADHVWHAVLTALGIAAAVGRPDLAARFPTPLTRWSPDAGARLGSAFRDLAEGMVPPVGAIGAGAHAMERFGFHLHANRIRLLGALAMTRVAGEDEAVELARAADDWFAHAGAPGWSGMARSVLRRLGRRAPSRIAPGGGDLTARELEVLRLVAEGSTNRQIAERLVISEPTAARHVANIFLKLRVNSRAEAVRVAAERDLLSQPAST
jgi:DNA-binding CsgD family transcriptional regulator